MALRGLWGSMYSHRRNKALRHTLSRSLFSTFELIVGEPIAADLVTPEFLQKKVQELHTVMNA